MTRVTSPGAAGHKPANPTAIPTTRPAAAARTQANRTATHAIGPAPAAPIPANRTATPMTAQAAAARAQANPTVIAMIAPARAAPAPANQTATHGTAPALAAIVTDRMSGADAPNPEADGPDADGPRSCIFITGNNRNGGNNDGLPRLCERYTMRTARRVQVGLRDTGCGSNAVLCPAFDAGAFPLAQMGSASDIQTNPRLGVATGMNGLCRSSARPIAISCLPLKVDLAEGQTIGIDCLFSAAAKSGGNYFGFVTISHDGENRAGSGNSDRSITGFPA